MERTAIINFGDVAIKITIAEDEGLATFNLDVFNILVHDEPEYVTNGHADGPIILED